MPVTRRRICCTKKAWEDHHRRPAKLVRRKTRKMLLKIKLNERSLNCKMPKSTSSKSGPSMRTRWRSGARIRLLLMGSVLVAAEILTLTRLKTAPRPIYHKLHSTEVLA